MLLGPIDLPNAAELSSLVHMKRFDKNKASPSARPKDALSFAPCRRPWSRPTIWPSQSLNGCPIIASEHGTELSTGYRCIAKRFRVKMGPRVPLAVEGIKSIQHDLSKLFVHYICPHLVFHRFCTAISPASAPSWLRNWFWPALA